MKTNLQKQQVDKEEIKEYWKNLFSQTAESKGTIASLRWFNEVLYNRNEVYRPYIKTIAEYEYHYGEDILEIGLGTGIESVQFARGGAKVTGLDLNPQSVELTKKNFKLNNLSYKEIIEGDVEKLPFKDNTFDYVYCNGVLMHSPNPDLAVKEIFRVLKPNGKCNVMIYAKGIKYYIKRILIQGIIKGNFFKYGIQKSISTQVGVKGSAPLTYALSKKQLKEMFSMFRDIKIRRYRLGEYFDFAPRKGITRFFKVPTFIVNLMYLFSIEKLIGEDFIIKGYKVK